MKANTNSIVGKRYGKLVVTSFSHTDTSKHKDRLRIRYWFNCQCDCGETAVISRSCLYPDYRGTKSCGCNKLEGYKRTSEKQKGVPRLYVRKPDGQSVLHTIFLAYKAGAIRRSISFNLDEAQFKVLTDQNCYYCGSEPREIKKNPKDSVFRMMNGVDRVDPSIGYNSTNCVPCCKICNYMKQELSEQEFYNHIERVLAFKKSRHENNI